MEQDGFMPIRIRRHDKKQQGTQWMISEGLLHQYSLYQRRVMRIGSGYSAFYATQSNQWLAV
jgi:hypothetical protein